MIKKFNIDACEQHGLPRCFDCLEEHHNKEVSLLIKYLDEYTDCWGECCDGSRWSRLYLGECPCLHHEADKYLEMIKRG